MGPLRGDGNNASSFVSKIIFCREDGSPSWGRKLLSSKLTYFAMCSREDGSPSWGRKLFYILFRYIKTNVVEKMGPLRGDGNFVEILLIIPSHR